MKILVTGGAGFIGSNFLNDLFTSKIELEFSKVYCLDSLTYASSRNNWSTATLSDARFNFILGDINDSRIINELVAEVDLVINFAAESHVDNSIKNPELFVSTNVLGVTNILNSLVKFKNKRLVQISTDEVYGTISQGSWDESFPVSPNSPYSASKASADILCSAFHKTYGTDVVITRCSNNYGPNQFPEKLIPLTIKKLLAGEQVPIYGNGLQKREWIHVSDHCDGIAKVARNGKSGEIYNIGSGNEVENISIVKKIISYLRLDESQISHVTDRLGHDSRYSVNYEKIRNELGFNPKIDFEKGLEDTIDWYVSNFSNVAIQ